MSLWIIYLLVMIPGLKVTIGEALQPVGIVLIVAAIALILGTVCRSILEYLGPTQPTASKTEEKTEVVVNRQMKTAWKYLRGVGYAYALTALFFVILPSEKQMYVMAGAYTVTNIEGISSLPENAVGAANAWLKRLSEAAIQDGDVETASLITDAITAAPVK